MESIPIALARNAGMNPIDSITQLRAKQNAGEFFTGVDVNNGTIGSFKELGVIEPLKVKEQIIKSATETANMILRIDNVIAVSRSAPSEPQGMPPGGMGMY
jgi:chaperonin GroEL (HSP60 family)